jgi:hypothetical protein
LEIDFVRDELAYDGMRIKTYALLRPVTVKARIAERVTD